MPDVVRMDAPGHLRLREDVSQIDGRHSLRGSFDKRAPPVIHRRIVRAVKRVYSLHDALPCGVPVGIIGLQQLQRFFPDEGQFPADAPADHLLVHRVFRYFEGVRGTIMTIHAIHRAMFAGIELLFPSLKVAREVFDSLALVVGVITTEITWRWSSIAM